MWAGARGGHLVGPGQVRAVDGLVQPCLHRAVEGSVTQRLTAVQQAAQQRRLGRRGGGRHVQPPALQVALQRALRLAGDRNHPVLAALAVHLQQQPPVQMLQITHACAQQLGRAQPRGLEKLQQKDHALGRRLGRGQCFQAGQDHRPALGRDRPARQLVGVPVIARAAVHQHPGIARQVACGHQPGETGAHHHHRVALAAVAQWPGKRAPGGVVDRCRAFGRPFRRHVLQQGHVGQAVVGVAAAERKAALVEEQQEAAQFTAVGLGGGVAAGAGTDPGTHGQRVGCQVAAGQLFGCQHEPQVDRTPSLVGRNLGGWAGFGHNGRRGRCGAGRRPALHRRIGRPPGDRRGQALPALRQRAMPPGQRRARNQHLQVVSHPFSLANADARDRAPPPPTAAHQRL